jgi:hypothetical protein
MFEELCNPLILNDHTEYLKNERWKAHFWTDEKDHRYFDDGDDNDI